MSTTLNALGGSFSQGNFTKFSPKPAKRKQDDTLLEDSEPSMEDEEEEEYDDKAEYEAETTLDVGTMQTSTLHHGYDSPRTAMLMSEITEERSGHDEIIYDDELDDYERTHTQSTPQPNDKEFVSPLKHDHHIEMIGGSFNNGMNGMNCSFKIKHSAMPSKSNGPQMSTHDTLESNVSITPLPHDEHHLHVHDEDEYGDDYDANYDEYYEDMRYAARPPRKKKYRQSDSFIKPPAYEDAKKQTDQVRKEKHKKRYSKYTEDSVVYPEDYEDAVPSDADTAVGHNKTGTFVTKNNNEIRLSITNEIDNSVLSNPAEYQTLPDFVMETPVEPGNQKELSLYFNKTTKDKYDDYEMNTYSSDSASAADHERDDSENVKAKYLKDPITPGPEDLDAKYASLQKSPITAYEEEDGLPGLSPVVSTKASPAKKGKAKPPKIGTNVNGSPGGKKKKKKKKEKEKEKDEGKKKKITLKQFMNVDLEKFVREFNGDNFDVAKSVCKHYDELTEDTDTVTIVADKGKGPNTAYWSKGDYNRVEKDCLGKYIMVYRACKHVNATVKVKQDIWESCVKGLCMDNLGHSQLIADKLDSVFGAGCHVSLASHDQYEVFCRYSDGYICEVELPSKDFVVAWRR